MSKSQFTASGIEEHPLTGGMLFLLAGLAALGALSTNIILPSFPRIGAELGITARELALTLSCFFVTFAIGSSLPGLSLIASAANG